SHRPALPAHRAASLRRRGSGLVGGLADDEFVARVQFSSGHRGKREVGHAESHLDRLKSLVGVQLPDNAVVLAQAIRHARTPPVLTASATATSIPATLRPASSSTSTATAPSSPCIPALPSRRG